MAYDQLKALAMEYTPEEPNALRALAGEYHRRYEREVLDLAAIAADVSVDEIINLGIETDADPQLLETLDRLGYSENFFDSWGDLEPKQIDGHIQRIKGTYFEVLVRDKLNAGESIGDIKLQAGEVAKLAEDIGEPGWDIEILNRDSTVVEQVQLKATESMSYVKEALETYPDIRVIVPHELDGRAAGIEELISTNITNDNMKNEVGEQLSELGEDATTDILHQSIEAGFDSFPGISAAVIGVTEARQVLMGRSTVEESLKRGGARLGRSSVYTVIGAGLSAVDAGIISVPTVMALRVAEGRVRHRAAMSDFLEEKTQEIHRELQRFPHHT